MTDRDSPDADRRLRAIDLGDAVLVCDGPRSDDWLVRFERRDGFDAFGWASRMVAMGEAIRPTAGSVEAWRAGPVPGSAPVATRPGEP